MKRLFALALAAGLVASTLVHGADALPDDLSGTWSTVAVSSTADVARSDLFLDTDGLGVLVGSSPTVRLNGADDGKPLPRAVVGMPVRAMLDGDMLTLHPFLPPGGSPEQNRAAERITIRCRQEVRSDAADPTLACTGPTDKFVLHRHGAAIDPEVARMLASLRSQARTP